MKKCICSCLTSCYIPNMAASYINKLRVLRLQNEMDKN